MKILILTTYYPPDTAIAAVRPYMFAKYLAQRGHQVTVLRSGEINKRCENFFDSLSDVRVISYLGENSPAEAYQRGQWSGVPAEGISRIGFLPSWLRRPVAKLYHRFTRERDIARRLQRRLDCHEKQKAALDAMKDEAFDIVFSTAGEFENLLGGQYAAKLFSCLLIQDFRDPMAASTLQSKKEFAYLKSLQTEAVQNADVCTAVSQGVLQDICTGLTARNTAVLYNGYEPTDAAGSDAVPPAGQLSFCYTGQLYGGLRDFSPLLNAICQLNASGKIALDNIKIHYAGKDFDCLLQQAEKYGITEILVNHGYVGRTEAAKMQAETDVFAVLSWNTATAKGVLTGKFYEGIRARKPILAIVAGDVPGSELDLINQTYRYGFCYEACREKEQFQALCDYLEGLYREKMSAGSISYTPDPALVTDFRYDTLSQKLEAICLNTIRRNTPHTGA